MIEFPTDAKFSNMQVVPKSDKALFIKDAPFLKKTSNKQDWEIPPEFLPKDYVRISVVDNLVPTITNNAFDLGSNLPHTVYENNNYFLNVGGVYRLTTSSTSSVISDFTGFTNDKNGHEIVESVNQDGYYVYTIAPRVSSTSMRTISIVNTTVNICSAAIVRTDTYSAKLVGSYTGTLSLNGNGSISTDGKITGASGTIFVTADAGAGAGAVRITQSFTF